MITNEVCLANLTVADGHSCLVLLPEGKRSPGLCRVFTCFGSGICNLSFQAVPKHTFTPCYYFLSWGGSYREGGLANPSCTWLMGLLQGCTCLFWISRNIFRTPFAIKIFLLPENYGLLNSDIFFSLWVCVGWWLASRSEICTVFYRSITGIMGSNSSRGMDVSLMSEFLLCCPVLLENCDEPKGYEQVSTDKIKKCLNSLNTMAFLMWNLADNCVLSTADEARTDRQPGCDSLTHTWVLYWVEVLVYA